MGATTLYGFSNIDVGKQIIVAEKRVFAGISRANQTISIYHGETLIADCTMPSAGMENFPTVVSEELTLHDDTFTGFIDGETYTIVAGDEPSITGFVINGLLLSFDESVMWIIYHSAGQVVPLVGSASSTNYAISQKITITKKRYDIKRLPEELLPKTVATKAEVRKVQTTAETAQITAETAQSMANAAQSTANAAQSTANAAQTTAETAKTTADNAKTTAESIKPNWNEKNSSKPGYIANRPFYHDITTDKTFLNRLTASAKLLIDGTELYWSGLVSGTSLLQIDENKIYVLNGTLEKFTPINFRDSYSYAYALGNPSLIKAQLPNAKDADGGELPDTGGDWVYYHTPGSSTVVTISKTKGWYGTFAEFLSEDLKLLDEKFIPASIQRTGGEVFLHSSTPNSTKKFKITVDDNGVISATEVVE